MFRYRGVGRLIFLCTRCGIFPQLNSLKKVKGEGKKVFYSLLVYAVDDGYLINYSDRIITCISFPYYLLPNFVQLLKLILNLINFFKIQRKIYCLTFLNKSECLI